MEKLYQIMIKRLSLISSLMVLTLATLGQNAPVTTAGNGTGCLNGMVEIPVTVSNFDAIAGIQLRLDFDTNQLTFQNVSDLNPALPGLAVNPLYSGPNDARINVFWTGIPAVSLNDGDTLFVLHFMIAGSTPVLTYNNTANGGVDCEYTDVNGDPLNDTPTEEYYYNTSISFYPIPSQPSAIIGNLTPCRATSQNYLVSQTPGITYDWSFPAGWTIVTGQGTHSVVVTTGENGGQVSVTPSNPCGVEGPPQTASLSVSTVPEQPSSISGPSSPCSGATINYSVISEAGVSYTWTIPPGSTIISGQGTNALVVTIGQNSGVLQVTPSNTCGAGTASTKNLSPVVIPSAPPAVSGMQYPCKNSNQTYSVSSTPNTTYFWSVPAGYTLLSGQGTSEITVNIGTTNGSLLVAPSNSCGTGPAGSLTIEPQELPVSPTAIIGDDNPCETSSQVYWVAANPIETYFWQFPTDWVITGGQGTDSVTVTVGQIGGPIQVAAQNDCGSSPTAILIASVRSMPDTATGLTGNQSPCSNDTAIYTIDNQPGITFTWTVPADWSIIYGQGTDSIATIVGSTAGNIIAVPENTCGAGIADTLPVQIGQVPGTPSPIQGSATPCQGGTRNYYVTAVAGITYTWTVPADWQILSGQGNNLISVLVGSDAGFVQVTPSNVCGAGPSRTKSVSPTLLPTQPAVITGNQQPCNASIETYSVASQSNVTFTWTVPTGWTITAGQGTASLTVQTGSAGGTLSVTPSNICGSSATQTLEVNITPAPGQPSAIAGEPEPCQGNEEYYEVTETPGITYTWTVPGDWIITSGQSTSGILVTVGEDAGQIAVTPSNSCGNGIPSSLTVTAIAPPQQPSPIAGAIAPCEGESETYSVTAVSGITYNWQVPAGWVINNGQGTSSINVIVGAISGNLGVTPENSCGQANPQLLAVSVVTAPAQPSAINGITAPCANSLQTYSVEEVSGLVYQWTFPAGWEILSGQGTANVEVTAGSSAGLIVVTTSNSCGFGPSSTLSVSPVNAPLPTSPISGLVTPCEGSLQTYSVTAMSGIDYTWSVPSGTIINSGQGTNTLNVTIGNTSGIISVTPSNSCGSGPATNTAITINPLPLNPGTISGAIYPCQGSTQTYSVFAQTGITYTWVAPTGWTITTGQGTSTIIAIPDLTAGNLTVTPSNACGNGEASVLQVSPMTMPVQPSPISGPTDTCELSSNLVYSVEAVIGTTFTWILPNGWEITSGQGTNSVVANAGNTGGLITVFPSNSCGTGTETSLQVNLTELPSQPVSITGQTAVCSGTTQLYTVPQVGNETYEWSVPAGWTIVGGQGTAQLTTLTGTTGGEVIATPYNGCGAGTPASQAVVVHYLVADAGPDQAIAPGTSTTLIGSATGSGDYSWSWEPSSMVVNPTNQITATIDLLTPVVYTLTVTDLTTTCEASDDVFVDVQSNILGVVATATPEDVCAGESSQLNALAMGGSGTYTYLWTSNPAGFTSNLPNPIVSPYQTTDYTVIVDDGTDVVYDIITVAIIEPPVQPATPEGPDSVNINMTPSSLYATEAVSGAVSYLWSIEPSMIGELIPNGTEATVNWMAIGRAFITVTAINACGEATSETKVVTVDNTIGFNDDLNQLVKVYPNPVADLLTMKTGGLSVTTLTVSDITGAIILRYEANGTSQPITIQTGSLKPGIYYLRIETPQGIFGRKIVKI